MPTASSSRMEDFETMSCHSLHHACECKEDLLRDAIDSLAHTVRGIEKYIKTISPHDKIGIYTRFDLGMKTAKSVLRRSRKI